MKGWEILIGGAATLLAMATQATQGSSWSNSIVAAIGSNAIQSKDECPYSGCSFKNPTKNNFCENCGKSLVMTTVTICLQSKRAADANCPTKEPRKFTKSLVPRPCKVHAAAEPKEMMSICPDANTLANANCPSPQGLPTKKGTAIGECQIHKAPAETVVIEVCGESEQRANTYCPARQDRLLSKSKKIEFCKRHNAAQRWKGIEMMRVPAGEFIMGSNDYPAEQPMRKVVLDEYWIGRYEVTISQFYAYCEAVNYAFDFDNRVPFWQARPYHPMVGVTWKEAADFCSWAGGALPTEAQWEKAARGTDARLYPWGSNWEERRVSKKDDTSPVGSTPSGASPYGCLDMAGNAWEWCRDWYLDGYDRNAVRNPTGPPEGDGARAFRGGSSRDYNVEKFRCSDRQSTNQQYSFVDGGFRLCSSGSQN